MKKIAFVFSFLSIAILFIPVQVFAFSIDPEPLDLEEILRPYAFQTVIWGSIILVLLAAISLKQRKLSPLAKKILFSSIVVTILVPTLFLAISTIYLNTVSSSKGPVHWHADFEVWNCETEVELVDPKGWSNKIGTATLHEHNDKRIHLEGVVVTPQDASLGKFFRVIGGNLTSSSLSVPTVNGPLTLYSGSACPSGEQASLQVFLFKTNIDGSYYQQKLENPAGYIISPFSQVPSGDCIIIELGPEKERTDKLCRSYKVAKEIGKLKGEIMYGN